MSEFDAKDIHFNYYYFYCLFNLMIYPYIFLTTNSQEMSVFPVNVDI